MFLNNRDKIDEIKIIMAQYDRITGMQWFPGVKKLYIANQEIEKIEGLDACTKVEKLWLCENNIKKIENLSHLKNLKELYLYIDFAKPKTYLFVDIKIKLKKLRVLTNLQTWKFYG